MKENKIINDLFQEVQTLPQSVQRIINFYLTKYESGKYDYSDSKSFLKQLNKKGFTFDYGLDNEPYNLRKL